MPRVIRKKKPPTGGDVRQVCDVLEAIAPAHLAQSWDHVGLIAGDWNASVRRILLCIDLTPAVLAEAESKRIDFLLAYHPPIFKPILSLREPGTGTDALVHRCIRLGMAIYATHTALDAAQGGTNDVLAERCDVRETEPLEYVAVGAAERKVVVFAPHPIADRVAEAMFAAGAGVIGDYRNCSFRLAGQGTFFGGDEANPSVGKRGRLEKVDEIRLEAVVPADRVPHVVAAIRAAHSYEEPAFDIYPLEGRPARGIGRLGWLRRSVRLGSLAGRLRRDLPAPCTQIVGPADRVVRRAIIVAGSAGSLPFRAGLGPADVVVTGEIRHHDALAIRRCDATAIALGHWSSERPVLSSLQSKLRAALPKITTAISTADCEPFGREQA